jgi:uncharacterized iron-regulated membrane protein
LVSKQKLVALHRWAALTAGIFLATMGVTGATLVYKGEIEARAHPERFFADAPARYEAVLATARSVVPGARSYTIRIPQAGHSFVVDANATDARRLHVDPRDGRLISEGGRTEDWMDFVEQLHTHLLDGDAGEVLIAVFGLFLLTIALTGLLQGWPRRWRDALRIRWGAKSPWLAYDLHRAAGLVLGIFLLAQALTGISMVFKAPAGRFVNAFTGSPWPVDPKLPESPPSKLRASLDEVVRAAQHAIPGARVTRVTVPSSNAPIAVRVHAASERLPTGLGNVFVNPYDASVLQATPVEAVSPGQRMFDWIFPLHTGLLFGATHQALQVMLGLSLPMLFATGLIVWARRRKARYKAREERVGGSSGESGE